MLTTLALVLILFLPTLRLLQAGFDWWQQRQTYLRHQPPLQLRVSRLRRQRQYLHLTLVSADGRMLPEAKAGQHIQLFGADAAGQPVSRAYSLEAVDLCTYFAQQCIGSHIITNANATLLA